MLVLLFVICVVFFAYALTFDKISDAVPASVKRAVAEKPAHNSADDAA